MSDGAPYTYTIVVDRNRPTLFAYFRAQFADASEIRLMLDRRQGDRRRQESAVLINRRRTERRGAPPLSWTALGYVMFQQR